MDLDNMFELPPELNNDTKTYTSGTTGAFGNCAAYLERPNSRRGESRFVGLRNQGGTCYMNSSLQVFYMNPNLRQLVYDLPLCIDDNINKQNYDFVQNERHFNILLNIQKLFIQLNMLDTSSIETNELTEAFSWTQQEGTIQRDSTEFIKILLTALEEILLTTKFNTKINDLFKIDFESKLICDICHTEKSREESNIDINLPAKDNSGVYSALENTFIMYETIDGYKCETCNIPVEIRKGLKIKKLPTYLMMNINRIDLDPETYEDFKMTHSFDFPLEIDMNTYLNDHKNTSEDNFYELFAIINHSGSTQRGHYYSYIRDFNDEGLYDLLPLNEFLKEPVLEKEEEKKEGDKDKDKNVGDKDKKDGEVENKEVDNKEGDKQGDKEGDKDNKDNKDNDNKKGKKDKKKDKNENQEWKDKKKNQHQDEKDETNKDNTENKDSSEKKDNSENKVDNKNEDKKQNKKQTNQKNNKPNNQQTNQGKNRIVLKDNKQKHKDAHNNKGQKKSKTKTKQEEEEHKRTNFDLCDFPIEYSNKELANKWFEFNDTSITPIRIGRLAKKFKSSDCAYSLFYIKKTVKPPKPTPPKYLVNFVEEKNKIQQELREIYEKEEQSLVLTLYESKNFEIDEFRFLTIVKDLKKLDDSVFQFETKLQFTNKLEDLLILVKDHYKNKYNVEISTEAINLYQFSYSPGNGNVNLVKRIESLTDKDQTLKDLKIYHKTNMIINIQGSSYKDKIDLSTLELGEDSTIITVNLLYKTESKIYKVKSDINFFDFKKKISEYLNIKEDIFITTQFNNNVHEVEEFAFEKKKNIWLTLKQLRISDNYIIIIKPTSSESKGDKGVKGDNSQNYDIDESIIVKADVIQDPLIINIKLNNTYGEIHNLIKDKFAFSDEEVFRVRKILDNKIIYKDKLEEKVCTDETFVEGSVRLQIEYGEVYASNEILINMIIEINKKKDFKEFIGDPNLVKLSDIKSLFCKSIGVKDEDFRLYKVNSFNDPSKQIKNENILVSKSGLKDNDHLYLKNINEDPYENYMLRFYLNLEESKEKKDNKKEPQVFKAIPEDNKIHEIIINKNTTLKEIKHKVITELSLKLEGDGTNLNYLRLRCLGKSFEPDKILRGETLPIKKLNTDNPANILIEPLSSAEDLNENQMQLYFLRKNKESNNYEGKESVIFDFVSTPTSDQLYECCRKYFGLINKNIVIAKYLKSSFEWKTFIEMDEDGPINLRKNPYSLRDGDWIAVHELLDNEKSDKINFQSKEDLRVLEEISKCNEENRKKRPPRPKDPPFRIIV